MARELTEEEVANAEPQQGPTLVDVLRTDVHSDYVSERSGLSYVTGRYVKQTLNQLFGPLGWGYEIIEQHPASAWTGNEGEAARWFVHLRLSVTVGERTVSRDGIAVGHGNLVTKSGPVSVGRASEVWDFAAAEAVTDALKRAASSLGQVLGLSLYPLVAGGKKPAASRPAPKKKAPGKPAEAKKPGFKKPKKF
jgi:recombination DNA repair RAD52 pathway protein